jgi:hypothetical protein
MMIGQEGQRLSGIERIGFCQITTSNYVATLGQLVPALVGKKLEGLLSAETTESISRILQKTEPPTKKEVGLYLAEVFARGEGGSSVLRCFDEITIGRSTGESM